MCKAHVTVEREQIFKNLLTAPPPFDWDHDKTMHVVQGDDKAAVNITGTIDFEDSAIQRRLDRAGALDQARAEGFVTALWLLSLAAVMENDINEWEDFFDV